MFSHFLAGELVFLIGAYLFGFDISVKYLLFGAFCGFSPDFLSHALSGSVIKTNKWYHKHRDNFSHSIFLPVVVFMLLFFWIDFRLALIISLAVSTHTFFDLWGIGWGVKLFLPFSKKVYKLFYDGRLVKVFKDEKEREEHVKERGKDDWFKAAYFFHRSSAWLKWWGIFEWASLFLAVAIIVAFI